MWLQGQIPFGHRSENMNVDGNSWMWVDIHANGMFSNPQVRPARLQPPPVYRSDAAAQSPQPPPGDKGDDGKGKDQTNM